MDGAIGGAVTDCSRGEQKRNRDREPATQVHLCVYGFSGSRSAPEPPPRRFFALFAILLFEKNIHAEEYSRSYIFNGKAKSFILERNSSYFTFITPSNKEMFLTILGEDDGELILGGAFETEGVDYY